MSGASTVLIILGGLFLLGGIGALVFSLVPSTDSATITVPQGSEWYYVYDLSLVAGGRITGTFEVVAGGMVDVFVFTDAQYQVYDQGTYQGALFYTNGSSGQLDVPLPGWDTFHLLFAHGRGYEAVPQDIEVTITLSGIGPPAAFIGGLVGLGLGAVFVVVGQRKQSREKRAAQAWPPPYPYGASYPPPSWSQPQPPPGAYATARTAPPQVPAAVTAPQAAPSEPPRPPLSPSGVGRSCPNCGASIPFDATFCPHCGSQVK